MQGSDEAFNTGKEIEARSKHVMLHRIASSHHFIALLLHRFLCPAQSIDMYP
jgi:hypothetical protein